MKYFGPIEEFCVTLMPRLTYNSVSRGLEWLLIPSKIRNVGDVAVPECLLVTYTSF